MHAQLQKPSTRTLTVENVHAFLLRKGFLDASDFEVTPGAVFSVLDYTSRNRAFKVLRPTRAGFLVKQAMQPASPLYADGIVREALLLKAVHQDPRFASMRWFTPRFVHFDRGDAILVAELIHPATTLRKDHANAGEFRFPADSVATAARILAATHSTMRRMSDDPVLGFVPHDEPYVWRLLPDLERRLRQAQVSSGPAATLCQRLKEGEFWKDVPRMRETWRANAALIHGDVRWDNFLLASGRGRRGEMNMRLIDWELVRRGDPAWDVACFLAEYVRFWVLNAATTATVSTAEDLIASQKFGFGDFHKPARAFWRAYCEAAALSTTEEEFGERVAQYVPATLVIAALETLETANVAPWVTTIPCELSQRSFDRPRETSLDFWGLPLGRSGP